MWRHTRLRLHAEGFTLIELLVVIAIVVVLWVIIMPPLRRPQEKWRQAQCGSNISSLALSALQYAVDHEERLPPARDWGQALSVARGDRDPFRCPGDDSRHSRWRPGPYGFSLRLAKVHLGTVADPATTPLFWDVTMEGEPALRHCGGLIVGFVDGHAKWFRAPPPGVGLGAVGPVPKQ